MTDRHGGEWVATARPDWLARFNTVGLCRCPSNDPGVTSLSSSAANTYKLKPMQKRELQIGKAKEVFILQLVDYGIRYLPVN
jgi:hypothetical protein